MVEKGRGGTFSEGRGHVAEVSGGQLKAGWQNSHDSKTSVPEGFAGDNCDCS